MIVADELLKPISEESPCGEDLSDDASLQDLEMMARGKEETQFSPAEPPNWNKLQARCLELFARSKDLRIVMTLAVTSLELDGLPGFREALLLVKGLFEKFAATVHPQLDPADNYDPLQRMNIVASLATPIGTFGDPHRILERVRAIPLCRSAQLGRFSLMDILRAESGATSREDKPTATMSQIESAFRDSKPEELGDTVLILGQCLELVQSIDQTITKNAGAANTPDLTPLTAELGAMRSRVAPYVKVETAVPAVDGPPKASQEVAGQQHLGRSGVAPDGEISSRAEVIELLKKICRYYDQNEPSSPVPLVLNRAARLVGRDFMQIIQDLTPDAISTIRTITGEKEE
jgi:type VI secretion system protein ImpA